MLFEAKHMALNVRIDAAQIYIDYWDEMCGWLLQPRLRFD